MVRVVTVLLAFSIASGLGCRARPAPESDEPPAADAPTRPIRHGVPIDKAVLDFVSPEEGGRFAEFDAVARQFAGDFAFSGYYRNGNSVSAIWARGIDFETPASLTGPLGAMKGIHRISVGTTVMPFPKATSAKVSVEAVSPTPDEWCVGFSCEERKGKEKTTHGWTLILYRWDAAKHDGVNTFSPFDRAKERFWLPLGGYMVAATPVERDLRIEPRRFLQHLRSATAMRDAYLADLADLEQRTVALIQQHKAQKKVYGKYQGRGIPPPSWTSPLTEAEEQAELAKAKQYFAAQAKSMREQHETAYAAWRRSFPVERCWPELAE